MILQQLYKDAPRILKERASPSMFDLRPIRWVINLSPDGVLQGSIVPLPGKRGVSTMVPYVGRTAGVRAILLADTPAYVLGHALDDKRAAQKHAAFKSIVKQCAAETGDPLVRAVDLFLDRWVLGASKLPDDLADSDVMTFHVDGHLPTESRAVQEFWARNAKGNTSEKLEEKFQCLVTGRRGPVDLSLPGMVKGIPDGQTSGTALVSANAVAFESFGLERAQTSPIGREAAEQFTKALNSLIAGERSHLRVGKLVYVFWTREDDDDFDLLALLGKAEEGEVKKLLQSARAGTPHIMPDGPNFFALSLSASGGRAVVRDWVSTTVDTARINLARWFAAQNIVGTGGDADKYYSIYALGAGLYRDANKDMTTRTVQALVRCALHGDPLPLDLLQLAVSRNRLEQKVLRNRAALIKAVLVSRISNQQERQEKAILMQQLDIQNTNPAYLCGRLLALLEVVQFAAVGSVGATLIDRYFGAAATTPATVFGVLLTQANKAHFPKLRKIRPGAYNALQTRIGEVLSVPGFTEFPRMLALNEQGLFALGYYHQRSADRRAIKEAKELKLRGKTGAETELAELDTDEKE